MPVIYCISRKLKKEIENISLKKFHIFLIFPLISNKAQYNGCFSYHKVDNFFLRKNCTYFENIVFPQKKRHFLCLICVINATIFFLVHITYLKFTRKKMRKVPFPCLNVPFPICLIKTFIELIK